MFFVACVFYCVYFVACDFANVGGMFPPSMGAMDSDEADRLMKQVWADGLDLVLNNPIVKDAFESYVRNSIVHKSSPSFSLKMDFERVLNVPNIL
eukprot:SAG11_NODE_11944_length_730_cov_1.060222_1_plen_95_part_00